ncbi:MAG: acyl-CoA desaturase, partial [Xanthomonadales bacterium PRO6]|nr:acyl-CoA desaturase [Xanthomonadales bacterium PRO6]
PPLRPAIPDVVAIRPSRIESNQAHKSIKCRTRGAWCEDAERSGVAALQQFAQRLKGYQLVGA